MEVDSYSDGSPAYGTLSDPDRAEVPLTCPLALFLP